MSAKLCLSLHSISIQCLRSSLLNHCHRFSIQNISRSAGQQCQRDSVCLSIQCLPSSLLYQPLVFNRFSIQTSHFGHRALSGHLTWRSVKRGSFGPRGVKRFLAIWALDSGQWGSGAKLVLKKVGDRAREGPTVQGPICMELSARMCNCVFTMYYTYCSQVFIWLLII